MNSFVFLGVAIVVASQGGDVPLRQGTFHFTNSTEHLASELFETAMEWMDLPRANTPCGSKTCFESFYQQEDEEVITVRRRVRDVSYEIATLFETATPFWNDDLAGRRSAFVALSVAFWETRFRGYVDDGRCNDPVWRKSAQAGKLMKLGTCDGGNAYSIFQVHYKCSVRSECMQEAVNRMRYSIHYFGDLRGYTGEKPVFEGKSSYFPKSKQRMDSALKAAKSYLH